MDLKILKKIAYIAGESILEIYKKPIQNLEIEQKEDSSPVTLADKVSHSIIFQELKRKFPTIPIISEEGEIAPYQERKYWEQFFLVDPLDGTKEFIKKNGQFTVNIALINDSKPIAGVVYAPVTGELFFAEKNTATLEKKGESPVILPNKLAFKGRNFTVLSSNSSLSSEVKSFIKKLEFEHGIVDLQMLGSSLKFCMVASGHADVYPRFGPTMEWDTAAAHAIAIACGCSVLRYDNGESLVYNKKNLENPFFIVMRK